MGPWRSKPVMEEFALPLSLCPLSSLAPLLFFATPLPCGCRFLLRSAPGICLAHLGRRAREAQLREQVAEYMQSFPSLFRSFLHGDEFLRFDQYCDRVRTTAWGDHLTLNAISALLLRPIRLIRPDGVRLVKPPDVIAESAWEPGRGDQGITRACVMQGSVQIPLPLMPPPPPPAASCKRKDKRRPGHAPDAPGITLVFYPELHYESTDPLPGTAGPGPVFTGGSGSPSAETIKDALLSMLRGENLDEWNIQEARTALEVRAGMLTDSRQGMRWRGDDVDGAMGRSSESDRGSRREGNPVWVRICRRKCMHRRHASAPLRRCAWAWSVPASPRGRRRSRPSYRRWWLSCPGADVRHALLSSTSSQARSFDCQLRAAN